MKKSALIAGIGVPLIIGMGYFASTMQTETIASASEPTLPQTPTQGNIPPEATYTITKTTPKAPTAELTESHTEIWKDSEWQSDHTAEGMQYYESRMAPELIKSAKTGDRLSFHLPEASAPIKTKITESKTGYGDVTILKGVLEDTNSKAHSLGGVSIVKGQLDTHLTIITETATYTVVMNNENGETRIMDEAERLREQHLDPHDGVETEDHPPPEPPQPQPSTG